MGTNWRRVVSGSLVLALAFVGGVCSSDEPESTGSSTTTVTLPGRVPTVSTPEAEGSGIQALATDQDYESLGYVREEFFVSGEAMGYEQDGAWEPDGDWSVTEAETASFATRVVVIRPTETADFSGTVFVEWFNVTGGVDAGPTWISGHNQMLRSGAAWVGVTAQAVGVDGGSQTVQSGSVAIPTGGLVESDPVRYGSLVHPGDLYSYDIFSQVGAALRSNGDGLDPLGGLVADRLIAVGESQSAFRLVTYVNAVQPVAGVYDGFLILSRGGWAAPLGDQMLSVADPAVSDGTQIRADVAVPVFTLETEYDVDVLAFADARQPNSEYVHTWEVAGTSHQDVYPAGGFALTDLGDGAAEAAMLNPAMASGGLINCAEPINAGGLHAVLGAGLAHLEEWVRDGTTPPAFDPIETTGSGDAIEIVRDELGIAEGGVRTPLVDVPLAANTGDEGNTPDFCRVFGHTRPFDAATLARLYPGGGGDYVSAFDEAVDAAVADGVWLEPEAENYKAGARTVEIG